MNYKDEFERENENNAQHPSDEASDVHDIKPEEYVTKSQQGEEEERQSVFTTSEPESAVFEEREDDKSEESAEESSDEAVQPANRVELKNNSKKKKKQLKGFASMVVAGVVGSVLTLTVLPYTDYMENFSNAGSQSNGIPVQNTNPEVNTVTAQPTSARSSSSIADTVEHLSKTIVGIVNYQQRQSRSFYGSSTSQDVESGMGTGVIFQKKNDIAYIVTNNHVVEGATKLEVSLYNGEKVNAEVVGTDALTDLAVLKIDSKNVEATAQFGDSSTLRPGDEVYAIGNPLGLEF